jgi:cobalt-zinc-cadmium efflux system membrane fusion protein
MNDRRWNNRWIVVAGASLAFACSRGGGAGGGDDAASPTAAVAAKTALVTAGSFTETVHAIGTVQVRPGHLAELSAAAPTRIAAILVSPGDRVARGQPLIELERTTFQATLASATAEQATAQQARDRAQRLVTQGILARRDLEQADADLARASADVVAAQRASDLATIKSPFDGVVLTLNATIGGAVDPSQPLIAIADPTMLDVVFSLAPADVAQLHVGDRVTLTAGDATVLGSGSAVDIGASVDSATQAVAVRVRPDRLSRHLRIGETLTGDIAAAVHAHALMVPIEALVPDGDGFKVFVVDSAHVAHETAVTVGGKTNTMAEITKGLERGDRVVTYGAFGVADSAKVVP